MSEAIFDKRIRFLHITYIMVQYVIFKVFFLFVIRLNPYFLK